jgi:hypothetical protein
MIEQFKNLFPALFPFFFIGMWILVLKKLSSMSGWATLAEHFHFQEKFEGKYYRFQSARLKKVNYSSTLEIGMNEMGLYMVPIILFRLFHQPLFIPWVEIKAEPFKAFLFKGYRLRFRSYPDITLEVSRKAFERMLEFHIALSDFQPVA